MLGTIASNFLNIGNDWTVVEKYATTGVYVGTYFFPQLFENSRSQKIACNNLLYTKNSHLLNQKGIDKSTENQFGITDGHQNCEEYECNVRIVIEV